PQVFSSIRILVFQKNRTQNTTSYCLNALAFG
ncbi:hypothetical protein BMETH_1510588683787, partial [methanotrophic bacterial endosymbiont of Bathymodiolus sp.]